MRTLVPSERGRVISAVDAGQFGAGEIVATAHLRDGGTKTMRMDAGV